MSNKFDKGEDTNFMYFIREIWRKKTTCIIVAVLVALLGGVFAMLQIPQVESGVPSDGVYEVQTQLIIKDDTQKQIIIDHKNNIAALITSASAADDTISKYNLKIGETELSKSLTVTTAGTNVVCIVAKIKDDPQMVKQIVDSITEYTVNEYKAVYPDIEISQTSTFLVGENAASHMTLIQKIVLCGKYLVAGAFIGLAATILVIGLAVVFNNKINTISDVENCLELPVIAAVHEAAGKNKTKYSEDVQRISINLAGRDEAKITAFVSGKNGEGRTHLIFNTAVALTKMGKKVLVINTDFRNDGSDKMLLNDKSAKGTLAGVTGGNADITAALTTIEGVDVLAAGKTENAFEAIASDAFDKVLAFGKENYDFVLVDTALMDEAPEALLVASKSDGAVYIAQCRKIPYKNAEANVAQLRFNGVKLLGAVLNRI